MQNERFLHDTGGVELWVRLLISPFGLLGVYGAFVAAHDSLIAATLFGVFGIMMLSSWLWRTRLFYDPAQRQIIVRSTLAPWHPWRIVLSEAEAIYVQKGRSFVSAFTDIGIRYQASRDRWLVRVPPCDSDRVASAIAEATALPLVRS